MFHSFMGNHFMLSTFIKAVRIYTYIYMLHIDGQTAGPIGLKFFVNTHGWPGCYRLKKSKIFSFKLKKKQFSSIFFPRATSGSSASIQYISLLLIDHTFYACLLINSWYYFHMFSPQQKILIIRCIFSLYTLYSK